jgi:predicted Mrr-cat superfamily restriction endonuclease
LWEREIRVDREGVRWGIIAIGWSFDMTRLPFHDEERLRSVVEEKLRQVDINSDPNYVARQARLFCREIRKGDIVVAYSKGHIYGIGQAADDAPYYVDVKGHMHETYENRRRVKWLALGKWRPEERFARVLRYPNDTIHKITDPATVRMIRKRAQESRDQ